MSCDYILPPAFPDKFSSFSMRDFVRDVIPSFRDKQSYWLRSMVLKPQTIELSREYLFNPLTVVLPFMIGKIGLNNKDGRITQGCAKWICAVDGVLKTCETEKTGDKHPLMKGTPCLYGYRSVDGPDGTQRHSCTFLKELKQEVPLAQQLRIPLVSLEQRHISKCGQARSKLEYIEAKFDNLTQLLVDYWKEAPLRRVYSQTPITKNKRKRKRGAGEDKETAEKGKAALQEEPPNFATLLSVLHQRANAVSSELSLAKHGSEREDKLTAQMVNGADRLALSNALENAGFRDATVQHQYTLDEGRPDIQLVNVKITTSETSQSIIVVEAKKRTRQAFDTKKERKSNYQQVDEYRDQLAHNSPYSILFNFEHDTCEVKFRWVNWHKSVGDKIQWHDYEP